MTYVNCIKTDCTHYCGRKSSLVRAKGNPIDLSILGNPKYLANEEDRDENIEEYAEYLIGQLKVNPPLIELLRAIPDDAVLGCFCFPKNCHCRVIIDACKFLKHNNV